MASAKSLLNIAKCFILANYILLAIILQSLIYLTYDLQDRRFFRRKMNTVMSFITEVWDEISKIVWPTREQTIRYTVLVIIVACAVGIALGALDYLLTLLTSALIGN